VCGKDQVNDELDTLTYDLYHFSNPGTAGDPQAIGFAPGILNKSPDDQITAFQNWFPQLYKEGYASDDNPPYYDRIMQLPDDLETEYLVEKGWSQAVGQDWFNRLTAINDDIGIKDATGKFIGGRISNLDPVKDKAEIDRLIILQSQLTTALDKSDNFKAAIDTFREAILTVKAQYDAIPPVPIATGLLNKEAPEYTWKDSLGTHHVRVTTRIFGGSCCHGRYHGKSHCHTDESSLPYAHAYQTSAVRDCVKLCNAYQNIDVTVERWDEPATGPGLLKLPLLWRMQYPRISYTVTSWHGYLQGELPQISSIRRNK
jgi:hypothetical protein